MLGTEEYLRSSIITKEELRKIIEFYVVLLKNTTDELYKLREKLKNDRA